MVRLGVKNACREAAPRDFQSAQRPLRRPAAFISSFFPSPCFLKDTAFAVQRAPAGALWRSGRSRSPQRRRENFDVNQISERKIQIWIDMLRGAVVMRCSFSPPCSCSTRKQGLESAPDLLMGRLDGSPS